MTGAAKYREVIVEKLAARAPSSSICPSEVARELGDEHWRDLMQPVRDAAQQLVDAGAVIITQGSETVDPATAKGPIRIRRGPRFS